MNTDKYPRLFEPRFCEISPEIQHFEEFEGEITHENIKQYNEQRKHFLEGLHEDFLFENVEKMDFSYRNGAYQGQGLVYRPRKRKEEKLPMVIYYHGGGWMTLCKECYEYECAALAEKAGCVVFNVDYRCLPDFRFPIPLQDCYAALKDAIKQATNFGADAERVALVGDSAGGNLAIGVSMMTREDQDISVRYLGLAYPVVAPLEEIDDTSKLMTAYAGSNERLKDKRVSPLFDDAPEKLPPMVIIIGTCDFLLDQNLRYVRFLLEHGGKPELILYQGMPHGFLQMTTPPGQDALSLLAEKLSIHLNR